MKHALALSLLITLFCACSKESPPAQAETREVAVQAAAPVVTPTVVEAPAPAPAPAAEPPEPESVWEVVSKVDPMTDETQVLARTLSIEPVPGIFGDPAPAGLIVRCANREVEMFVAVPNMVDYDPSRDSAQGRYRFGTKQAEPIGWGVSTDRKGVFFFKARGWVKILQNNESEVFTVQVPIYSEPAIVARFSLVGAKTDLQRVLDTCS